MAISTILITARRNTALAATIINRGPTGPAGAAGADGADGEDGASDVGDLTTDGLTPGEVLVVDNPSGVTTLALGTAALVNTGTGATNAILGNDSRLTDPRTPNDHTHGYTDLLPESEEFVVSSSVYFDGSNNLTLTTHDSHRLRIGTDDMVGYSGVLQVGSAPTAGTVVIVWNARTDTTTVENSNDETLGTIAAGNCGLLTSNGSFWAFASFGQRALLTLADISPLPIANGGTGAATAALARSALGVTSTGDPIVTAADAPTAFSNLGTLATASPNDTVNSFTLGIPASGFGSTNVAINIKPKGTGAFYLGPPADGEDTVGGNPRGESAVDLQTVRTAKTQVAGKQAFIGGGSLNTASGTGSVVSGGRQNRVSGDYASIAGGLANTVSGSYSFASGAYNQNTGYTAFTLGYSCFASGTYSLAIGNASSARLYAGFSHASGSHVVAGDSQRIAGVVQGRTGTNVAVPLTNGGGGILATAGMATSGTINLQGINVDGTVVAHFMRQFSMVNFTSTISTVDGTADTVTFTANHQFVDSDPVTVHNTYSYGSYPGGLNANTIYYVKKISDTTIAFYTEPELTNIVNLTGTPGNQLRYVSTTRMVYSPAPTLGTDFASGTSVAVSVVIVPSWNVTHYLSIAPTGLAATATPVTGCVGEVDDVITKTGHGLTDTTPVILTSLTGGAGLTLNTVVYYIKNKTDDTFNLATTSGGTVADITTKYTDMTVQPANVMRWTAHVSAVETAYGT